MKKTIHFERLRTSPSRRSRRYYAPITVVMKFKKPVSKHDANLTTHYIDKALGDLEKAYPQDIINKGWFFSSSHRIIYVSLYVSQSFFEERLTYGDWWAPEKYLGYYLSRIARRIRKSDRFFEKYFKDGMFSYRYIYY